jgi:hypothetical protein
MCLVGITVDLILTDFESLSISDRFPSLTAVICENKISANPVLWRTAPITQSPIGLIETPQVQENVRGVF